MLSNAKLFLVVAVFFALAGCATKIKNPIEFREKAVGRIVFTVNKPLAEVHAVLTQKERECSKPNTYLPISLAYEVWSDIYEKTGRSTVTLALFGKTGTGGILLHSELTAASNGTDVVVYYLTEPLKKRAQFRKKWIVDGAVDCDLM